MKRLNIYKTLALSMIGLLLLGACDETEPVTFTGEFINLETSASNLAESNEVDGIEFKVNISKASSSDITFDLVVTGTAVEDVDYSFPDGKTVTIKAGEYSDVVTVVAIENDDINDPRSFTVSLPDNLDAKVGAENSFDITVLDNDFYCPENDFAVKVTTETDLGYGSGSVYIVPESGPGDDCLVITIYDALVTYGLPSGQFSFTIQEDSPESNAGIVVPETNIPLYRYTDGAQYNGTVDIVSGTYDRSAGEIVINYANVYGYSGTFIYN